MLSCDEFCTHYWAHYVSLEKEFLQACGYVELDSDNYQTFSSAYLKLLLEIGSEIDVAQKYYCGLLDAAFSGSKINDYRQCIDTNKPIFFSQEVSVKEGLLILQPWNYRDGSGNLVSPHWWTAYNKCKHNRTESGTINGLTKEYRKFANLEYTLNALAGLYQTLIFANKILADNENNWVKIPLPGSRLFTLTGTEWNDVNFFGDYAFTIDNGSFLHVSSTIYY